MSVIGTFNGVNIIQFPCDTMAGVPSPSSIEWEPGEAVASVPNSFTGQVQTFDWMGSWWEAQVSLPPMNRSSADAWSAFLLECRGQSNFFLVGDPKAQQPKGTPAGSPLVNGASQTGYYLNTDGWTPSRTNLLLGGDFISIPIPGVTGGPAYRLYKVIEIVNSNSSGQAQIHVWPNLRDLPPDNSPVVPNYCKGLFRLAQNANKWSTNVGVYGVTAFKIREAI